MTPVPKSQEDILISARYGSVTGDWLSGQSRPLIRVRRGFDSLVAHLDHD